MFHIIKVPANIHRHRATKGEEEYLLSDIVPNSITSLQNLKKHTNFIVDLQN